MSADERTAPSTFGEMVRFHRQRQGLSQVELAELSGYSRSSIVGIENGRRDARLSGIHALADALQVSPAALFSGVAKDTEIHAMLDEVRESRVLIRELSALLREYNLRGLR